MSNTCKLTGVLTDIFPIENKGNFTKRLFWLKQPDSERYPQHWELELHNADVERLKGLESGDIIACDVEIRGHYYVGNQRARVFNTLKCTGLKLVKKLRQTPTQVKIDQINDPAQDDDLPF